MDEHFFAYLPSWSSLQGNRAVDVRQQRKTILIWRPRLDSPFLRTEREIIPSGASYHSSPSQWRPPLVYSVPLGSETPLSSTPRQIHLCRQRCRFDSRRYSTSRTFVTQQKKNKEMTGAMRRHYTTLPYVRFMETVWNHQQSDRLYLHSNERECGILNSTLQQHTQARISQTEIRKIVPLISEGSFCLQRLLANPPTPLATSRRYYQMLGYFRQALNTFKRMVSDQRKRLWSLSVLSVLNWTGRRNHK